MGEEMQSPKMFWSPVGSNDWQELGEPIKTPTFRTDEDKTNSEPYKPQSFSCEAEVDSEKVSSALKEFMDAQPTYDVNIMPNIGLKRLPRKLKKAVKDMWFKMPDGFIYVKRWSLAYGYKVDSKWKRKGYHWLMRMQIFQGQPILKIPHYTKEEIEKGLKEFHGRVMPCVEEPNITIMLNLEIE